MKKRLLIVPCCTEDPSNVIFQYAKENCMINCVKAISGLPVHMFDEVIFVLLKELATELRLQDKILADCQRLTQCKARFILLNSMTKSPAETVRQGLLGATYGNDISDYSVFIKDADGYFSSDDEFLSNDTDMMFIASLEDQDIVDAKHKSYVKLDEQGFITNAIEGKAVTDKFCAGGYFFNNAKDFFDGNSALNKDNEKFYISDIVFWLILNKSSHIIPQEAKDFKDFNI